MVKLKAVGYGTSIGADLQAKIDGMVIACCQCDFKGIQWVAHLAAAGKACLQKEALPWVIVADGSVVVSTPVTPLAFGQPLESVISSVVEAPWDRSAQRVAVHLA